jgi:hypothetical protein
MAMALAAPYQDVLDVLSANKTIRVQVKARAGIDTWVNGEIARGEKDGKPLWALTKPTVVGFVDNYFDEDTDPERNIALLLSEKLTMKIASTNV